MQAGKGIKKKKPVKPLSALHFTIFLAANPLLQKRKNVIPTTLIIFS
jgi:hypothetical protein